MSDTFIIHWIEKERPGWYEYKIDNNFSAYSEFAQLYDGISSWILSDIEMPYRHARWKITISDTIHVRFRYERDFLRFVLRWA